MRTLYVGSLNASSWSMRAWLALREKGVSFERVVIDLTDARRGPELARLSPNGRVPVLIDGDAVIFDSLAIMEYAHEAFDGPALLPADVRQRARARSLLAWMHAGLGQLRAGMSFESTFHSKRPKAPQAAYDEAAQLAAAWEAELTRTGGPYLCGALSLADLTFVPVLRRFAAYDVPLGRRAKEWRDELMARPSVREWVAEAEKLPPFPLDR